MFSARGLRSSSPPADAPEAANIVGLTPFAEWLSTRVRAGLTRAELDRAGVGGRRRRSPKDVADEVSDLYHRRGVRILHMVDDNIAGG